MIYELPYAGRRQRRKLHPDDTRRGRELSHDNGEGMIADHLLGAERGDDHQPGSGQPATHEPQDVQGRFVSPLDVVEQEQHRPFGQHVAYPPKQPEPAQARLVIEHRGELGQRVHDRAERFGRRNTSRPLPSIASPSRPLSDARKSPRSTSTSTIQPRRPAGQEKASTWLKSPASRGGSRLA